MKSSFFVEIGLPDSIKEKNREVLSQVLLRLASRFSFLGLEDWEVSLRESQKVLGIEREFFDLRKYRDPAPRMCAYFQLKKDAENFSHLLSQVFPELNVKKAKALKPKDWMKEWRKVYRPQKIEGKKSSLWVVPAWMKKKSGWSVWVHPGQAFGTGTHPTTRLCLRAFLDASSELPIQSKIFDFGSGTGILGIAAAVIGREKKVLWSVRGVETDPQGIASSKLNARKNRVAFPVSKKIPKKKFQFVFANVLAPVLLEYRKALLSTVAPGGTLVLSGILKKEAKAFQRDFFQGMPSRIESEGDWAAITFRNEKM